MRGSVLVTGGARRIGATIAATLRSRGWNVLVHARAASNPLAVDLSEPDAAERLFEKARAAAPDLCALVNNAAAFSTAAALSPEDEAHLMRINARTPVKLMDLLGTYLRTRSTGYGAVVNLLDARILRPIPHPTPYERSKIELREAMMDRARRWGSVLRVNAVAPGPVLAPADPTSREKGGDIVLRMRPTPEDVAQAVAFLLETPGVTGQVLAVDSGQSLLRGCLL